MCGPRLAAAEHVRQRLVERFRLGGIVSVGALAHAPESNVS